MTSPFRNRLTPQFHPGGEQVRARQRQGVVGGLEESDRATDVVQRLGRTAIHRLQTCQRPVQTNARIWIDAIVCSCEGVVDDVGRTLVIAGVGECVAEEGRVANLCRRIRRHGGGHALEASLKKTHGAIWSA